MGFAKYSNNTLIIRKHWNYSNQAIISVLTGLNNLSIVCIEILIEYMYSSSERPESVNIKTEANRTPIPMVKSKIIRNINQKLLHI